MYTRRWMLVLAAVMLMAACAPQAASAPPAEPTATIGPVVIIPTAGQVLPTSTTIPLPTAPPAPAGPIGPVGPAPVVPSVCTPQVKANSIINVRNGPTTNHSIIGSLAEGETAKVDGKNADGTWYYIVYGSAPNGHGWVAASVTTAECISPSLTVIESSSVPAPFVAAVTNVVVGVDPGEENVPGCVQGEAHRFTATATISASGPMQITYSWEIEGYGTTKPEPLTFSGYQTLSVSQTFKPDVDEGRHMVRFWIEGLDMRSWSYQTSYRITCS